MSSAAKATPFLGECNHRCDELTPMVQKLSPNYFPHTDVGQTHARTEGVTPRSGKGKVLINKLKGV